MNVCTLIKANDCITQTEIFKIILLPDFENF